jgi:hypothetical protein
LSTIPGRGAYLKFYPIMSTTSPGNITYLLRWGTCEEKENLAHLTGVELNPCPPNQPGQ